jgi:hypothetical protein
MKQTAVEWLVNEFNKERLIDLNQKTTIYLIVQQAKEMEKEQIIDAFDEGNPNGFIIGDGEQYYNEQFKQD